MRREMLCEFMAFLGSSFIEPAPIGSVRAKSIPLTVYTSQGFCRPAWPLSEIVTSKRLPLMDLTDIIGIVIAFAALSKLILG
jgi:hypothetical protein